MNYDKELHSDIALDEHRDAEFIKKYEIHKLHLKAGLISAGKDKYDNQLYMGTDKQWTKATILINNYLN